MSAILAVLSGCGDDALETTVAFRLHGPPPVGFDGRCPSASDLTPVLLDADSIRLTYRQAGGGALVCDAVLNFGSPNQVVAVPNPAGQRVDVFAELYRNGTSGPELIATGEARAVDLARPEEIRIFVTPREQFACTRERMTIPRAFHASAALPNGEVLISGGVVSRTGAAFFVTESMEIYDDGDFRPVSAPGLLPRAFHAAIPMEDDTLGNHRVALVGGITVAGDANAVSPLAIGALGSPFRVSPSLEAVGAPTEIITYDVANQSISVQLLPDTLATVPRVMAGVSPGSSGSISALAGGWTDANRASPVVTIQTIDPGTGGAGDTVDMVTSRYGATVTQLAPAQIATWGGQLDAVDDATARTQAGEVLQLGGAPQSTAIAFADPQAPSPRAFHSAAAAGNGDLIVAGGFAVVPGSALAPAASFVERVQLGVLADVTALAPVGGVATPAGYTSALGLADGDVLITGGNPECPDALGGLSCASAQAFVYRNGTAQLEPLLENTRVARYGHTTVQTSEGMVMLLGGVTQAVGDVLLVGDAELFNPVPADFDPVADLNLAREPGVAIDACPVLSAEPAAE